MSRIEDLQRKRADAMYELEQCLDERDIADKNVQSPPVPTPAAGPIVKIGARECRAGDYNTVARLWRDEVSKASERLRQLDAEIAKAQRST